MFDKIEQAVRDVEYAVDRAKEAAEDYESEIAGLKSQMEKEGGAYEDKIADLDDEIVQLHEVISGLEVKIDERDEEIDALKEQIASLNDRIEGPDSGPSS